MFFPTKQETLEIQCNSKDLLDRLESATIIDEVKTSKLDQQKDTKKQYWFHGRLEPDAFKIALLLKRPNNFIPLVNGIIAEEAGKCNLVLHYELFPATKRLLLFWSLIALGATLFFAIPYQEFFYAAIALSFGIVNYIIAVENFKMQARKSRSTLKRILQKANNNPEIQ
jgi:hypothetical protein